MFKLFLFLILSFAFAEGQYSTSSGCAADEFPCLNGQCIPRKQWCDETANCRDKSDEKSCKRASHLSVDPNSCRPEPLLFLCGDGTCIPIAGRCDRTYDCSDNSDEKNCTALDYKSNRILLELTKDERSQNRPSYSYRYATNSYKDLPYETYSSQLSAARNWLKSQQRKDYGWGDYTARAVISMYLSRENVFPKTEDDFLMDKQLDIELFVALTRNETSSMSLSELALYINSLLAACKNPRNFYGYDLVNILRDRADKMYPTTEFVSPLIHLTLCLTNATVHGDVQSLQSILDHKSKTENQNVLNKVDIISLAVLASSCIIKNPLLPQYSHPQYRERFVRALLDKIKKSGLPGNIYELSLAMQALNEAEMNPNGWERDAAIDSILQMQHENGSFGDILGTYYTIPILSGKSLLSLSNHCDKDFSNGKIPLAIVQNTKKNKISVIYTLFFGDPMEMSQKITLQVAEGANFLDVMQLAGEENANFRFSLDESKNIPFVYSIGGVPNDAERGLYWTLHVQNPRNPHNFIPFVHDIKEVKPTDNEEVRFWLKRM